MIRWGNMHELVDHTPFRAASPIVRSGGQPVGSTGTFTAETFGVSTGGNEDTN